MLNNAKNFARNVNRRISKLMMWTGLWCPVLNIMIVILMETTKKGEWDGISREEFFLAVYLGIGEALFVIVGNLIFHYFYGSRDITLLSFAEGLLLRKKYDNNDLKTIFPDVNNNLKVKSGGGNIVFGKWHGRTIGKPLDQQSGHVNVIAATGGGKTTNCIFPTIFNILEANNAGSCSSFLAVDIKGELEAITKKVSHKNSLPCTYKVFNPEREDTYGFNPYFILRDIENNDEKIEIFEEIASILIPMNNDEKGNSFWIEGGRSYLTGALWYYYDYEHLGFIESLKNIAKTDPYDFALIMKGWQDRYIDVYYSDIYPYAEKREKTLSFFFSEVKRNIQLFGVNHAIAEAFSKRDEHCIEPEDLLQGINIFLQISEMKMPIYNKACALIINMFVRYFVGLHETESKLPDTAWLLDEFAQLPYMPSMDRCVSTVRSKGVTLVFCLQEPENQLRGKYGAESAKVFMQNCTYNIIYTLTGESAEYFSKDIGEYDKITKSYSKGKSESVTISTRKERIFPAQEFRKLKDKRKAVLLSPYGYNYIDTAPWYREKKWM